MYNGSTSRHFMRRLVCPVKYNSSKVCPNVDEKNRLQSRLVPHFGQLENINLTQLCSDCPSIFCSASLRASQLYDFYECKIMADGSKQCVSLMLLNLVALYQAVKEIMVTQPVPSAKSPPDDRQNKIWSSITLAYMYTISW
jgi:hypothetical protein